MADKCAVPDTMPDNQIHADEMCNIDFKVKYKRIGNIHSAVMNYLEILYMSCITFKS